MNRQQKQRLVATLKYGLPYLAWIYLIRNCLLLTPRVTAQGALPHAEPQINWPVLFIFAFGPSFITTFGEQMAHGLLEAGHAWRGAAQRLHAAIDAAPINPVDRCTKIMRHCL